MSQKQISAESGADPRFRKLWNRAHRRWRRMQAMRALEGSLWLWVLALMIWLGLAIWRESHLIQTPLMLKSLAGIGALAVFSAWINWVDPKRLARTLDRRFDLKDGSRTALELDSALSGAWKTAAMDQWVDRLEKSSWKQRWPIQPTRWTLLAIFCLLSLGGVLQARYSVAFSAWESEMKAKASLQSKLDSVEEMFKDWEKELEKNPNEALEKALKDAEPLREKIAEKALDQREALLEMSRLEEQLAKMAEKMKSESLEPLMGEMASALEPLPEMEPTAQALKKKNAAKAQEELDEASQKYEKGEVALPDQNRRRSLSERLKDLAEQMAGRGQQQASQSMSEMAEGLEQGTPRQMSEAMESLQESLAREAMRQAMEQMLQAQMGQMQEAKQMVAQGNGEGEGENSTPFLADQNADQQEKGIGAGIDETPTGDETKSDAERKLETQIGQVGDEGDSQSMTLSSNQGTLEQDTAYRVEDFSVYEKMSLQAIGSENLPATHKRMLRQYFETIRPQAPTPDPEQ